MLTSRFSDASIETYVFNCMYQYRPGAYVGLLPISSPFTPEYLFSGGINCFEYVRLCVFPFGLLVLCPVCFISTAVVTGACSVIKDLIMLVEEKETTITTTTITTTTTTTTTTTVFVCLFLAFFYGESLQPCPPKGIEAMEYKIKHEILTSTRHNDLQCACVNANMTIAHIMATLLGVHFLSPSRVFRCR